MAESAVGIVIEVVLEKLLTLAAEQISVVRYFNDDLKRLGGSLTFVRAFLHDAEKKKATDESVKDWLRELEDLAFDADNVIDDMDYILLSKQVKKLTTNKKVKEKVQSLFSWSSPISYRQKMGSRIKVINERLENVKQLARDFRLVEKLEAAKDIKDASGGKETDSFAEDRIFHGRENEVSEIVKMLTSTSPAGQKSSCVLPIVGMGGQGKTTIARKVFNDERMKSHFGDKNRIWVYVSQNFDVHNILKNILKPFSKENVELDSKQVLLQKLQEHLGDKKYLLVLDDVWNENREVWDDFVNSLSGTSSSNNGYCMIVTTRSEEVASIVKDETLGVHKLKGLPEDDCWSIIKAQVLRGGDVPSDVEEIGKNIAKKCQGLPLAANVVGGLLSSVKSKDEWKSIEENWLSDDENSISNVLKLSFDHLPSPSLKKCFAYCSIFPKGYKIEKERLVELWMAEGFLQKGNNDTDMESTGSNNINILLRKSLLQNVRSDDYGNVTHCNMHDLVHDLARSILCEGASKSRYIGYKPGGDGLSSIPKGQEGCVRTLFLGGEVSDINFSNFESLHTLTLVGKDIQDLPTSIRELKHLRYLDISDTRISCLPDSISKLYHLQTLRSDRSITRLPDSLSCLISLRHLHISYYTTLPREIGKLTCLQTLPWFRVGGEKGREISELGKLKDLKGKLEIHDLQKVRDKTEAESADLIGKSGIYKIHLGWFGSYREGDEDEANVDKSVLEGLEPHPDLRKIEIQGYKGKSLPLWTSNIALQLMEIKLMDCSELEEVPSLGQLRNLKSLLLCDLTNVKSIGSSFYGTDNNIFPMLKRLELDDLPNLKEWDEAAISSDEPSEVVVFPCLEYLKIQRCRQLMRAPSHFPCLKEVEILWMESSIPLENICGMKLTTLTRLEISEIKELECLPDGLFSNNCNLKELQIWNCPKMTHLVPLLILPGGGGAPSLRELRIWDCWSLRELPDDFHSLNSLEKLDIRGCPELKSIPSSRSGSGGQQQFFEELEIRGDCPNLVRPILGGGWALSLRELWISDCRSLRELPDDLHSLTSLEKLVIERCPQLKSIPSSYPSSRGSRGQQ